MNDRDNRQEDIDTALLKRCRNGDERAFEVLYQRYSDKVYGLLFHLCQDREVARDMAQQTFLKFFTSIESFRQEAAVGTWLHRIATNTWLDQLRRQKGKTWIPLEEKMVSAQEGPTPEEKALQQQRMEVLNRAISELSDTLRPVFLLKYVSELSYKEISEVLDCSIGTVGSRLNAAVEKLSVALHQAEEGQTE